MYVSRFQFSLSLANEDRRQHSRFNTHNFRRLV
jgi:hypothetical protein